MIFYYEVTVHSKNANNSSTQFQSDGVVFSHSIEGLNSCIVTDVIVEHLLKHNIDIIISVTVDRIYEIKRLSFNEEDIKINFQKVKSKDNKYKISKKIINETIKILQKGMRSSLAFNNALKNINFTN